MRCGGKPQNTLYLEVVFLLNLRRRVQNLLFPGPKNPPWVNPTICYQLNKETGCKLLFFIQTGQEYWITLAELMNSTTDLLTNPISQWYCLYILDFNALQDNGCFCGHNIWCKSSKYQQVRKIVQISPTWRIKEMYAIVLPWRACHISFIITS